MVRRAEMLAELMRLKSTVAVAGTHGKTTTTSMIAALLDAGGIDPTVINGGIINAYGSNARLGSSGLDGGRGRRERRQLPEARRHDRRRHQHRSRASRPLRQFDAVKDAYVEFVENVPFYGAALLCVDHPEVQSIIPAAAGPARRHLRLRRPGRRARRECRPRSRRATASTSRSATARPGPHHRRDRAADARRHNVQNALAAIGVAAELGIPDEIIARGFEKFHGVKRRFTKVGEVDGVTIIDDYGHHPVEIKRSCRPRAKAAPRAA